MFTTVVNDQLFYNLPLAFWELEKLHKALSEREEQDDIIKTMLAKIESLIKLSNARSAVVDAEYECQNILERQDTFPF